MVSSNGKKVRSIMKESDPRLTRQPMTSTLRSEGTSMAEQGQDQAPKAPESKPVEPVKAEATAPKAKLTRENLTEWAQGFAKEQGLDWDKLDTSVRAAFIEHAKEYGRPGPGTPSGRPPEDLDPSKRELLEALNEFNDILHDKDILSELKNEKPNFDSPKLKKLKEYMETKVDPTKSEFYYISHQVAHLNTPIHKSGDSAAPDVEVSESSRRILFEWMYEKIIGRADKGSEEAPYGVGSYEVQAQLDRLDTLAMNEFPKGPSDKKTFYTYLSELKHVRSIMHDLNRNLEHGDQYKQYVLGHLRTAGLDFVQNELAGANAVMRLYEKIIAWKVANKREWLNKGDIEDVKREVEKVLRDSKPEKDGRILTDWEIDRALRLGVIMMAGTQRTAMYAALGDLPPGTATTDRIASLPYEYIARAIVPFKVTTARFFTHLGKATTEYLGIVLKEQQRKAGGAFKSLFGLDFRTMILNSNGALDPQSHGWRSQEMFLGNVKIALPKGPISLLDLLNKEAKDYNTFPKDKMLGGGGLDKEKKSKYSRKVREAVLGQRLYLSVLQKNDNFDTHLKTVIWQKIALLKPTTIASLLPKSVSDKAVWEQLRFKLYAAEERRVTNDSEKYKSPLDENALKAERHAFGKMLKLVRHAGRFTDDQFKDALKYMGMEGLELASNERELLEDIIKFGVKNAKDRLATAKMPFTFIIDDAPTIAWKKTGESGTGLADEDLFRILLSDQEHYGKGWGAMNGFFESPNTEPVKQIATAVEEIGHVTGREPAQDIMEPFIIGWLKFASKYKWTENTPGADTIRKLLNMPTSPIQRFFRESYISYDARDRKNVLQAFAQAKAIRDNLVDAGTGLTQLERMREKVGSDKASMLIYWTRIMILLFGAGFAVEFLKTVSPDLKG
jgi:hypothetical protein